MISRRTALRLFLRGWLIALFPREIWAMGWKRAPSVSEAAAELSSMVGATESAIIVNVGLVYPLVGKTELPA